MNYDEKSTKIYKIILKNIANLMKASGIKAKLRSKNDNFINDLGLDSLDVAEILVDVEMMFEIEIPEKVIQNTSINTVDDVIKIVDELTDDDNPIFYIQDDCCLKADNECCCNCDNRWQDFYLPDVVEQENKGQRGWACVIQNNKKVYSQLTEHGICDKYVRNKNL